MSCRTVFYRFLDGCIILGSIFQVRERLRVSLERNAQLEEDNSTLNQEVSAA